MKEINFEQLEQAYKSPIIGVIGATSPSPDYDPEDGVKVGYVLREFVDSNEGNVFTGGVSGVGVDAYLGVMRFCIGKAVKTGKIAEDRFFVLIPERDSETDHEPEYIPKWLGGVQLKPRAYNPPEEYSVLARINPGNELKAVRAGETMYERRKYVAKAADKLVVVNGSYGTLDEAINTLRAGKEVISLSSSGGSAHTLSLIKNGKLHPQQEEAINTVGLSIKGLDLSLIHCFDSVQDITRFL